MCPGLQASTILVISFGSRLPQIAMNMKRGNSGQLSLVTCLLNVLGCIARLFTTLVMTQVSLLLEHLFKGKRFFFKIRTFWLPSFCSGRLNSTERMFGGLLVRGLCRMR